MNCIEMDIDDLDLLLSCISITYEIYKNHNLEQSLNKYDEDDLMQMYYRLKEERECLLEDLESVYEEAHKRYLEELKKEREGK